MPKRKRLPEKIERFQHKISEAWTDNPIIKEGYPDVVSLLPLRKRIEYVSDGLVPPKATPKHSVVDDSGTVLVPDACQPICEWIVNASHAYQCLLERQTDPDGQRGRLLGHIVIPIRPTTKKNSSQLITNQKGRPILIPSKLYRQYVDDVSRLGKSIWKEPPAIMLPMDRPLTIKAIYYRKDHRRCDITNLESALMDVLVSLKIIADDNYKIVCNTDGSRVKVDKENPRTELWIYAWNE